MLVACCAGKLLQNCGALYFYKAWCKLNGVPLIAVGH